MRLLIRLDTRLHAFCGFQSTELAACELLASPGHTNIKGSVELPGPAKLYGRLPVIYLQFNETVEHKPL